MKLAFRILFVFIVAFDINLEAQNLIPNGDFEDFTTCPDQEGQIGFAEHWESPTRGSTDFFHRCAGAGPCISCVPNMAQLGFQEAQSGDGMVGMFLIWKSVPNYREYMQAELISPLQAGTIYEFTMHISFAEYSFNACEAPQVLFSTDQLSRKNSTVGFFSRVPQIAFDTIITDRKKWVELKACFTADGGEQYITLGNFKMNAATRQIPQPPGMDKNIYYFMDNFSLVEKEMVGQFLPNDTILCQGDSLPISLPVDVTFGWAQYIWSDGLMGGERIIRTPGVYVVDILSECGIGRDTIEVSFMEPPQIAIPEKIIVCPRDTVIVHSKPADGDILWSTGSKLDSLVIIDTGLYWLEVSNPCGVQRDTFILEYLVDIPDILPVDSTLCDGDSLIVDLQSLNNQQITDWRWNDGDQNAKKVFTQPGVYWVDFETICGIISDTMRISRGDVPRIILPEKLFICDGGEVVVKPPIKDATALWNDGSMEDSLVINQPGLYWLELTNACGAFRDSIWVEKVSEPESILPADTVICDGDTLWLFADPAFSPIWQNQFQVDSFAVTSAGPVSVELSNICGILVDVMNVQVEEVPFVAMGQNHFICEGDSVFLRPWIVGDNWVWQDGSKEEMRWVLEEGWYWVEVQNQCGWDRDSAYITVENSPTSTLPQDTVLCEGENWIVQYPSAYQVTWQDGSTNQEYMISTSGNYIVDIESNCGMIRDSVNVVYIQKPKVDLGNDTIVCSTQKFILKYSGSDAWSWSDGTSLDSLQVATTGKYWINVSNQCGIATDTIDIEFENLPSVNVGIDLSICEGESDSLSISTDQNSWIWSDGSMDETLIVDKEGVYFAEVSNSCGIVRDSLNVDVIPLPVFSNVSSDVTICNGDSITLNAQSENGLVFWLQGDTSNSLITSTAGDYIVVSENQCGEEQAIIEVVTEDCGCDLFIPNSFSPNGDNINDAVDIKSNCDFDNLQWSIFSRWGELVFQSNDIDSSWNGEFNGSILAPDVFVYILQYSVGDREQKKTGSITIVR